eukprot:CAMPEP_0171058856 /NCGR_PEP_ID=MMETSP0766_2-20121228/2787_1 /TAXON_ID=439317 /ORGANISM="Gambierdiscus australes, Strain CAWD 149" /LENGTH=101 /DNA_ID=CAMNT_0011514197 /DNA_START=149 /DNA_END=450 /DNA_ORIENTATION=+
MPKGTNSGPQLKLRPLAPTLLAREYTAAPSSKTTTEHTTTTATTYPTMALFIKSLSAGQQGCCLPSPTSAEPHALGYMVHPHRRPPLSWWWPPMVARVVPG